MCIWRWPSSYIGPCPMSHPRLTVLARLNVIQWRCRHQRRYGCRCLCRQLTGHSVRPCPMSWTWGHRIALHLNFITHMLKYSNCQRFELELGELKWNTYRFLIFVYGLIIYIYILWKWHHHRTWNSNYTIFGLPISNCALRIHIHIDRSVMFFELFI